MDLQRRYMSDTSQLPHDNDDHSKEATTMFQFSSMHQPQKT